MTKERFKKGEKVTYKGCSYIIKSINDKWASVWDGYKTYLAGIEDLLVTVNKRIMTKEDLKNTKIYLSNEEDVIKFQEKAFELGVLWNDGSKDPQYIKGEPFYYINSNFRMTKDTMYQNDSFKNHEYKQIFLHDVLSIEEPEEENNFKPFDRVLVRDNNFEDWHIDFFSTYTNRAKTEYPYRVTHGYVFKQCIPYEGNEHLVGTTNSPD